MTTGIAIAARAAAAVVVGSSAVVGSRSEGCCIGSSGRTSVGFGSSSSSSWAGRIGGQGAGGVQAEQLRPTRAAAWFKFGSNGLDSEGAGIYGSQARDDAEQLYLASGLSYDVGFLFQLYIPGVDPLFLGLIAAGWPILFGGQAHWTVGLLATIVSCSAVAAADVFAYLGGKTFGKTPLISRSPKKTLEGAAVGLGGSVAVTILLSKVLQWPSSTPSAAVLGVLVFMASLFGDLTESMMKRDAGVKDSGQLIPGHGGVLDRVDSYIFTGALVYSFVKIGVPLFGV